MKTDYYQQQAKRFAKKHGWVPTWDQLQEFIETEPHVVGAQFTAYNRIYYYMVKPGPDVQEGDYLAVYSPLTNKEELVRVVEVDNYSMIATKYASRIEYKVVDE